MSAPTLKKQFEIRVEVAPPVLIGQDDISGRRQLIPILSGTLTGTSEGNFPSLTGEVLPGGVDSQVIRPDGKCELSARYGVRLTGGEWAAPASILRTMDSVPYRKNMSRRYWPVDLSTRHSIISALSRSLRYTTAV